ncbi:nitrilase family protein, partial [Paramuribaculum intestinale]
MPESNLKVAVMPHDIIENDAKANIEAVSRRISSIDPDTDLLVLPEMFNTGYSNIREQLRLNAEPDNGPTMQAVEGWAKDYNMAIWGGFTAVDEKDRIYNRGFMTDPDGNTV